MNRNDFETSPALRAALSRSKGAMAWLAVVSFGCVALWSAFKEPQGALERAQAKAARAVEWSLAGESSKLDKAMTKQAAAKVAADRSASGLDQALTATGQSVKARAEAVEATLDKGQWAVRGLATAKLSGSPSQDPWRGAWEARLDSEEGGELRVSSLRLSSLPAGAPYDAQGAALALRPPPLPVAEVDEAPAPAPEPRKRKRKRRSKAERSERS